MSSPLWRAVDDEYLRANYADTENKDLAFSLNRTVAAVVVRANRLGLHKDDDFLLPHRQRRWANPPAPTGETFKCAQCGKDTPVSIWKQKKIYCSRSCSQLAWSRRAYGRPKNQQVKRRKALTPPTDHNIIHSPTVKSIRFIERRLVEIYG